MNDLLTILSFSKILLEVLPEAEEAINQAIKQWGSNTGVDISDLPDVRELVKKTDSEVNAYLVSKFPR